MDNLISRQAAIDLVEELETQRLRGQIDLTYPKTIKGLKALPPAQQWIPCSKRLPETTDEVLTTYIVNGNRKKKFVETATYYDGDKGYWSSPWDEYRIAGTKVEVIAWMPLPKPYIALATDRDCEHCVHRKDKGCEKWDCEFERRTE